MIFQSKRKKPPYTKPEWEHSKCNTDLHVWKKGSTEKDRCYCKRKTLKASMRTFVFIEGNI